MLCLGSYWSSPVTLTGEEELGNDGSGGGLGDIVGLEKTWRLDPA